MPKSSSLSSPPSSPSRLGYRLPAEWHWHEATWLSWPHNGSTWPCGLEPVYRFYRELVTALATDESVRINVNDEEMEQAARQILGPSDLPRNIHFHHCPTNDAWIRDYGAMMVNLCDDSARYPNQIAVEWGYNAWGNKYPPFHLDDALANSMARALEIPSVAGGLVLEGGSIDVNGAGDLLTTESCLLNPNRNPSFSREQIEVHLQAMLGVERIHWLGEGIAGDDTDGHVDDLTRFVGPATVVTVVEEDPRETNYQPLRENLKRLQRMQTLNGDKLRVETLPMPRAIFCGDERLPASYANFYIANRKVLVPQFRQASDEVACATLRRLIPARQIVGLDCVDVVAGLGAIHCLTQQVPAA